MSQNKVAVDVIKKIRRPSLDLYVKISWGTSFFGFWFNRKHLFFFSFNEMQRKVKFGQSRCDTQTHFLYYVNIFKTPMHNAECKKGVSSRCVYIAMWPGVLIIHDFIRCIFHLLTFNFHCLFHNDIFLFFFWLFWLCFCRSRLTYCIVS